MGFSFLPSEVARLVLGYLEEQKCTAAYNEFLNTSKHLEECKGRTFLTQIMGMSLTDILDDYCAVHSYVTNASLDDRIKQHLKKCLNLLDKIKLSFDGDTLLHETPDTPPKNIYRRTRKRCNSTNSISTIQSEKSHNFSINSPIYAKELEHSIDKPKCSTENLTESTNLADLPGHKKEYKPKQIDEKLLHNSTNFNSKLICKRKFSKSLDNLCSNETIMNIDEMDFRHALGLIKQSDLLEKNSKALVRRKGYKPRICLSARKSNTDNFLPNESLSITTISNTLLDFPELHRKIADNINKIKNERISLNKTDLTESKNSPLNIVRQEFNEVPKNSNILIDDFSEDIESVVKSIVDITAKDPIFDQIINELTASFESISGSDSDIISRPDTSTPEHYSSNAVSRTSSFGSQENNIKKSKDPRTQKPKNSKLTVSNVTESVSETALIPSTSQKSLSKNLKLPQISYPRYSRGGKRMDILKANYGKYISPTTQNSVEKYPNDEKLLITQNPEVSQPKVIILSNERVQTNIVSTTGPIIISNIENINENNKVVTFSKSKMTDEKMLQPSNLIKNLKCIDDFKYKQQDKQYNVDEKNETSQKNIFFDGELISSNGTVLNSTEIIFQPPDSTNSLQPSNSTHQMLKETSTNSDSINQPKPLRKVTGKPTDLVISNNGCIPIENRNINESSFVNITPTTEFEVVNIPQIISINDEINNHYYENLPNGLIRLLPKIETHPDYPTFVKIEEPDKSNCEFQIIDAKGFGAYTSDTNSIAETKGSVPLILPTSYNSTVPTQTKEHLVLNKNHSNLQEINLFNVNNSACSENKILKANDVPLEECVVIEINDAIEENNENLKTPNGIHTVKKICSSTPRKNSHIRILDFSTPEKANVGKRKAATSPKSISNKFRNVRSRSKSKIQSKVCLFDPISEKNTKLIKDGSEVIILDSVSPSNKLNAENDSINIDKSSNKNSKIEKKSPNTGKNNCKKKKKKPVNVLNVVKSKRSWDRDLRAMLGESFIKCSDEKVVKNTNKAKTKVSKSHNPDSSLENDAKRLEDALNKSQDTPIRDSSTFPKKNANVNDKVIMNSEQVTSSKPDSSVLNIIDDLDLSTNTTLDDSQSAAPKNVLSDNQNTSIENLNSKPLKDSISFYSSFSKKIHMDDFNNVLASESKKENHSSSTIKTKIGFRTNHQKLKVKIGSKMISAKKLDSGISARIDLTSPVSKELGSTNDDSQSVEEISKSSLDQDIPDTSLTTPELPREYRSNPIDVKCNLSTILETPFKTCILDLSMRTPRFLSPGMNSDPISMVKILGIPTPNFIDTPITAKTPELLQTPGSFSSKKTDYSSGSSYYKPDEIDAKFLSNITKEKKKPNILSKSPRKKPPVSSTISKLLSFRRKMCSRPKRKTPVKKVFPVKKKISTAKPQKDNSKQITKHTNEYSLRSSSKLRKNNSENEIKNDVLKSPNEPKSSKINTKYNSVGKKQQKDMTCKIKKKGKSDSHLNKESKENEKSAKVSSSKDKFKNESVKNHPKTPTIKFSTVPDNIFSINKNLLLPHINSPSKSKRKSSTPRKIHSLSTQIDYDFIDNPSEFLMLKSSNSIIDCPNNDKNDGNFIPSKLVSKNDTQKECLKDNVHNPKNISSAAFKSQILKKLDQKGINTKIANTLIQELSDYSGQDLEDSYSVITPKCLSEITTSDICDTPGKKSESECRNISINSLPSMSPEQIKENVFDISANVSKSNEMTTTIKDCHASSSIDENEPYLDITWSKHEVICHNYISDCSPRKKKICKQKEPPNNINLEKLNMNVEVFDTQADCMKVTSLKASNFIDLFDMQSNVQPNNNTPPQKESKSSDKNDPKQTKKEDGPRSGLQMLMEEIARDSSASESSSPIKNIVPHRKIGDLYASERETELAIKSILVEDNSIFSPIKITYENLYTEKLRSEEIEIMHDSPINNKTNVTIEKRKRESDSEDATLKKSKSSDSSANNSYVFKNFDIEEVLSKLHGTDQM